jgi:hypothetical protein
MHELIFTVSCASAWFSAEVDFPHDMHMDGHDVWSVALWSIFFKPLLTGPLVIISSFSCPPGPVVIIF